jgi:hypothetical protein
MRPAVNLWIAGPAAAQLTPSVEPITGGDGTRTVVRTCALNHRGLTDVEIDVTVDEVTAKKFAVTCRLERIWKKVFQPALLVAAALLTAAFLVDTFGNDSQYLTPLLFTAIALAFVAPLYRLALVFVRSRHHPRVVEKGNVLIEGVDRQVAQAWLEASPPGTLKIVG